MRHSRRTCADANFNANGRGVRSVDTEADASAVGDAGRYRDAYGMVNERIARATAGHAGIRPDLAPASTFRTCAGHRYSQRQRGAEERFAPRNGDLGSKETWLVDAMIVHESVADPRDDVADRRKVDRCFIGEAIVGPDFGRLAANDPVHAHFVTLSHDAARLARCQDRRMLSAPHCTL